MLKRRAGLAVRWTLDTLELRSNSHPNPFTARRAHGMGHSATDGKTKQKTCDCPLFTSGGKLQHRGRGARAGALESDGSQYDRLWSTAFFAHWRGIVTGTIQQDTKAHQVFSIGPRLAVSTAPFIVSSLSASLSLGVPADEKFDFAVGRSLLDIPSSCLADAAEDSMVRSGLDWVSDSLVAAPCEGDTFIFTISHVNASRTKLPYFASRASGDSLVVQPLRLRSVNEDDQSLVVLLENPNEVPEDSLQLLSTPLLQQSDIQSMRSWTVSDKLQYFIRGFNVPDDSLSAWGVLAPQLVRGGDGADSKCAEVTLTSGQVAEDASRLSLLQQLELAGFCTKLQEGEISSVWQLSQLGVRRLDIGLLLHSPSYVTAPRQGVHVLEMTDYECKAP